ncbi:MAG: 7-carboxy-7-deazaguanine synthase QueE [Acidiferrobacterales bacterium]
MQLRITEIFYSLQGESRTAGFPTIFIRLTGCPLRCQYCDTSYAFKGGSKMTIENVMEQAAAYKTSFVTVTGGEPLAQAGCHNLLTKLCDQGFQVSLETSGALDISGVDQRVCIVMDLKTPDSSESGKNLYSNIEFLKKDDQVKFVIGSRDDYLWSRDCLAQYNLSRFEVLFSPVHGKLPATDLADWILADQLKVRLQVQLHKILWGDERGR